MASPRSVKVSDIARILIKDDPNLIENWRRFYLSLKLDEAELVLLDNDYKRTTITAFDLFFKIINAWALKATLFGTIENLIHVLQNEKFNASADRLTHYALGLVISPTSIGQDPTLTTGDMGNHFVAILPEWYNMKQPVANLQGRDTELTLLFEKFETSTLLNGILISGEAFIGKSELARRFASELFRSKGVSLIWINGNEIESELMGFMTGLGIQQNTGSWFYRQRLDHTHLKNLSRVMVEKGKWLIVFDGIDETSMTCFESVLNTFNHFPPGQNPFVIVTTRSEKIKNHLSSCMNHYSMSLDNWLNIKNNGDLPHIITYQVTPWVREHSRCKRVAEICMNVDAVFPNLFIKDIDNISFDQKTLVQKYVFTLLIVITYLEGTEVVCEQEFLRLFCNVLTMEDLKKDDRIWELVLGAFIDSGLLLKNAKTRLCDKDVEVASVVNEYLRHPGINIIIGELIGVNKEIGEVDIWRWLFHNVVRLPSIYSIRGTCSILLKVIEAPFLSSELKVEIAESVLLQIKHNARNLKVIDEHILKPVTIEISQLWVLNITKELAYVSLIWYNLAKLMYGNVDERTLEAGEWVTLHFDRVGMNAKAVEISKEMLENCRNELGEYHIRTLCQHFWTSHFTPDLLGFVTLAVLSFCFTYVKKIVHK